MFVDCIHCKKMNQPGGGASEEVPAMVLTHEKTGEKFYLCKPCAEMWEQAAALFGMPGDWGGKVGPLP